jgi:hypothetical protein
LLLAQLARLEGQLPITVRTAPAALPPQTRAGDEIDTARCLGRASAIAEIEVPPGP